MDFTEFSGLEPEQAASLAEQRYRALSPLIEQQVLANCRVVGVSSKSVLALDEAVTLHRLKHYRAVTRLVFPTLEQIVRSDVLGRRWGTDTLLRGLRERLNEVALQDHIPEARIAGFKLFESLERHFFDRIESLTDLARFEASGIPNRHACVHGMIDYDTFQHSINSLIFADYIVRMVAVVRSTSAK